MPAPQESIEIGSVQIRIKYLVVIAVTVPLLLLMTWIVQKTKVGKAMRATAQDRDASLREVGPGHGFEAERPLAGPGGLPGPRGRAHVQPIGGHPL